MSLVCGVCTKEFEPRDGTVDIFRTSWDSPGIEVCKECVNSLASHQVIKKDDDGIKCRCQSLDPAYPVCPVHDGLVKPVSIH